MMNLTSLNSIVLVNSIENTVSADFINEFDRLTSISTTNQSISIDNENEEAFENAVFYAQKFMKSHAD